MSAKTKKQRLVLLVIDGWGVSYLNNANVFASAKTHTINKILDTYPATVLEAGAGMFCLDKKVKVTADVGFEIINTGCVYGSETECLEKSIDSGTMFKDYGLADLIKRSKQFTSRWHLVGCINESELDLKILESMIQLANRKKIAKVFLHLSFVEMTQVRALEFVKKIESWCLKYNNLELADLCGSDYAINQSNDWTQTKIYYQLITGAIGHEAKNPSKVIKKSFERGLGLNQMYPTYFLNDDEISVIKDSDVVVFFNHGNGAYHQLKTVLGDLRFNKFEREFLNNLAIYSFSKTASNLKVFDFAKKTVLSLNEILTKEKLRTLFIGEAYKVLSMVPKNTISKQSRKAYENIKIVNAPLLEEYSRVVALEDSQVIDCAMTAIKARKYDFIEVNIASLDIVAKLSDFEGVIKVLENIDSQLADLLKLVLEENCLMLITSSSGRIEKLKDIVSDEIIKENTNNPVPLILIGNNLEGYNMSHQDYGNDLSVAKISGTLLDVAPTVLGLLGVEKTKQMSGKALL